MSNVVVTDLDGTLVRVGVEHMEALSEGLPEYHRVVKWAEPNNRLARILEAHREKGRTVVAVTARDTRWAPVTRWWLKVNLPGLADIPLYMRAMGDERPDHLVKVELLERVVADHGEIGYFHDDHPENIALAESLGVANITRHNGYEENKKALEAAIRGNSK